MPERGFALWQLGFRPFYLLAAIFAALSVGAWAAQFAGYLPYTGHTGPSWHAHETIFGYTFAVIAGFLFTIVRNWTHRPTPAGVTLAVIVALWLAARILVFTPWSGAVAVANVTFALAVTAGIAVPLWQARDRRNYFFAGLMMLITAALVLFHLSQLDVIALPAWAGVQFGMDVVLLVIAAVAGRVVPIYTNKAVPGARARRSQNVERLAMGGLTTAMMIRTARAHTGRALIADGYDIASCVLLAAAAAMRVFWPLIQPQDHVQAMLCSALLWSAAFLVFIVRHGPALVRPRLDDPALPELRPGPA